MSTLPSMRDLYFRRSQFLNTGTHIIVAQKVTMLDLRTIRRISSGCPAIPPDSGLTPLAAAAHRFTPDWAVTASPAGRISLAADASLPMGKRWSPTRGTRPTGGFG